MQYLSIHQRIVKFLRFHWKYHLHIISKTPGASPVVQWLRICLAMQGTQARALVGELSSHAEPSNWIQVPQLKSLWVTIKDPNGATKTQHSQINKQIKIKHLFSNVSIYCALAPIIRHTYYKANNILWIIQIYIVMIFSYLYIKPSNITMP